MRSETKPLLPYAIAALFVGALMIFGLLIWIFKQPNDVVGFQEKILIIVFILACTDKASSAWVAKRLGIPNKLLERLSFAAIGAFVFAAVMVEDTFGEPGTLLKFALTFVIAASGIFLLDIVLCSAKVRWRARKGPPPTT